LNDCEKCNRGCGLNLAEKEVREVEKSLIIIKPDGIQKKVVGKVITRFEDAGFEIEQMKMIHIDKALATRHYKDHTEKAFFKPLIKYICSGPVIVMVIKGEGAIKKARELMGPTDSKIAPPGTIRGDFGVDTTINVIHGSDSMESADREIELFFE
jgi:nucleoside-diphosphate kinase